MSDSKELSLEVSLPGIASRLPEHREMMEIIRKSEPEIQRGMSQFGKTQSQFMDNMLTVSHLTPLRNLRQILAEMNKTREALKEAYFAIKKKEIQIKIKDKELERAAPGPERELIEIEIMELRSQIESTSLYVSGAVRKLAAYTTQYNSIRENYGISEFSEQDFENEEERYHIMKAFEQGLNAARSRGGIIDEGNLIYLSQIGINCASAQREVTQYLNDEATAFSEGREPSHKMVLLFLERMAQKYAGSAKTFAALKGMTTSSAVALLRSSAEKGDK